jgi:hypothetical protein
MLGPGNGFFGVTSLADVSFFGDFTVDISGNYRLSAQVYFGPPINAANELGDCVLNFYLQDKTQNAYLAKALIQGGQAANGSYIYVINQTVSLTAGDSYELFYAIGIDPGVSFQAGGPAYPFDALFSQGQMSLLAATPTLHIQPAPTNSAVVWWPAPAPEWSLQENATLGGSNWLYASNAVSLIGGQYQVTVSPLTEDRFYRLIHP